MTAAHPSEGRRVLRNVASFGAFAMSPLLMMLMIRALGPGGYGRWWWTFVLLEAATYFGMFGTDLFIRREVSRLTREGKDDEVVSVVGSGLAVVGMGGVFFVGVQTILATQIASVQGDPGLLPYLLVLAWQPLLSNLGAVMIAALQSRDVIGSVALLKGVVFPLVTAGVLFASWQLEIEPWITLVMMLGVTVIGLATVLVLYARHLSLSRTLAGMLRPRHVRAVLRYGSRLVLPLILFVLGGKLDLYIVGAHFDAAYVGVYAACLQMASGIPNVRALLDPVIQTQVGALYGAEPHELGASLQRLTRLCVFALAPAFVMLIAVGEPVLGWMLGHPAPIALVPLAILSVGQLAGSMAVASWVISMMLPGRLLAIIAGATLVVKLILLLALVPSYGLVGAAIATAVGTIIAMQGQALAGAYRLGFRPYAPSLLPVILAAAATGALGRVIYTQLSAGHDQVLAVAIAAGVALAALGLLLLAILDSGERTALRRLLGLAR